MAAVAIIRGRFVARTRKSWNSFQNQSGETIAAGRSLDLHVVTDGDEALEVVKVARDDIDRAEQATGSLKFGDRVEFAVTVDRYGSRFVDSVPLKGA